MMFKLTPMRKIEFVFPRQYQHEVTIALGRDGYFESINMQEMRKWQGIISFNNNNTEINDIDLFINKVLNFTRSLDGEFIFDEKVVKNFQYEGEMLNQLQNELEDMEKDYNNLDQEMILKNHYLDVFDKMVAFLKLYNDEDLIEMKEFCLQNECYFISQGIKTEKKKEFDSLFCSIDYMLPRPTLSNCGIPLIFFDKSALYKVKNNKNFLSYLALESLGGTFYQKRVLLSEIEKVRESVKIKLQKLTDQVKTFSCHAIKKLNTLYYRGMIIKKMLEQECMQGLTEKTVVVCGWVPFYHVQSLSKRLCEVTEGALFYQSSLPSNKLDCYQVPPTQFNNPFLVKPFERIITTYAVPTYSEIDPTFLVALSFVIMFGMMFGDLGQGLVFIISGLILYFNKKASEIGINDVGVIVISLGLSASFFGICYGSIFGIEEWIRPILYSPMHHINQFLELAIIYGVIFITIGIALNMINAFHEKDYKNLLLSSNGLVGLWFYWGSLLVIVPLVKSQNTNFFFIKIIFLIIMPLILMVFIGPLGKVLNKNHIGVVHEESFVESFFEMFDTILRYLSNSISFVRLGAFALTHIALMSAIFILSEMIQTHVGQIITIIAGNIFVILFEGLIVSIQVLRLEYYEFFTKFFRGKGHLFKPFNLYEL